MRGLLLAIAFSLAGAMSLFAADADKHSCCSVMGKAAGAPAATALAQKTCPVSGKPIKEDSFIEYEGRKVYFCCDGCPAKFKESPDKYLPALYRQIHPQRVQVKCPVMGGPIDPKVFADYKGQRVYFCCDECPKQFNANPDKYLPKLAQAMTDQVHCPVTGKGIDASIRAEYQGKTVYFSSKEALEAFKANPAKYAERLLPEAGVVARGATADDDLVLCPTCVKEGGGPHSRKQTIPIVYKGRVYDLCSKECVKEFQAKPEEYIKVLEKEAASRADSSSAGKAPSGHTENLDGPKGTDHGPPPSGGHEGHAGHQH